MRVVAVIFAVLLAGCLQSTPLEGPDGVAALEASVPGQDLMLDVTVDGQTTPVAVTYWPGDGSTLVLALHGSAGARGNHAPTDVPGYSFAHAWVEQGFAVAALDYPGYGDSPDAGLQTMEELADVTVQVADTLRQGASGLPGHDAVVGFGISMGGLLTQLTQAEYQAFDAIVSASWSYGGFNEEYQQCVWMQQECPEDPLALVFHMENMEPAMIDFLHENSPSAQAPTGSMSINMWAGCPVTPEAGPPGSGPPRIGTCEANDVLSARADDVTTAITIPVLLVFGEEDRFWEDVSDEADRFPGADVATLHVPDTGHVVIWHRSHHDFMTAMIDWTQDALYP